MGILTIPKLLQLMPVYVLVFFRVAGLGLSAPLFASAKIPPSRNAIPKVALFTP